MIAISSWQGIITTTDGGNTWLPKSIPAKYLYKLDYKSDIGLAVGITGYIIIFDRNLITSVSNSSKSVKVNNFILEQNYPNPFNPTTRIKYSIPHTENVIIRIYDILGKRVATLVDEEKPAGNYEIEFDGINLSSGIYFYQIRADGFIETKKNAVD